MRSSQRPGKHKKEKKVRLSNGVVGEAALTSTQLGSSTKEDVSTESTMTQRHVAVEGRSVAVPSSSSSPTTATISERKPSKDDHSVKGLVAARRKYRLFLGVLLFLYVILFIALIACQASFSSSYFVPILITGFSVQTVPVVLVTVMYASIMFLFKSNPISVFIVICVIMMLFLLLQMFNQAVCFSNRPLQDATLHGRRYWLWMSRIGSFALMFPLLAQNVGDVYFFELAWCSRAGWNIAWNLSIVEKNRMHVSFLKNMSQTTELQQVMIENEISTLHEREGETETEEEEEEDDCVFCCKKKDIEGMTTRSTTPTTRKSASHSHITIAPPSEILKDSLYQSWVDGIAFWAYIFARYGMLIYERGSEVSKYVHLIVWIAFAFYVIFVILNGVDIWEKRCCCCALSFRNNFNTMYLYETIFYLLILIQSILTVLFLKYDPPPLVRTVNQFGGQY